MIEDGVGLSNGLLIALGVVLVFLLGLSAGLQAQASLSSWFPSKGVKSNVYKGHADEKHAVSKADTLDLSDIASSQRPKHIAVIMDGNRRFGKQFHSDPLKGHWHGMQTFIDFIKWCQDYGLTTLTAYAFSTENWGRDQREIELLMSLFIKYAENFKEEAVKRQIRVNIVSTDFDQLPAAVQAAVSELQQATASFNLFTVNFCLSYGSRREIVRSVRSLCDSVQRGELAVEDIDEKVFAQSLGAAGEPDILLRTSGECRLSNFLLWQLAYTELFFVDKFWPQLTQADVADIIRQYVHRNRRFGI